jgi:hypothetical protein
LKEEHCGMKRKDHMGQTQPGGKGLRQSPCGVAETAQRGFLDSRHFLCQQDSFFLDIESQDLLHYGQPSRGQNCPADIQSIQGNISVLPLLWLLHHNSACGRGIGTPHGFD